DRRHGAGVDVAGADPDRLLEVEDEDLAVADLAGAAALAERRDGRLDELVGDRDLEPDLVREPHLDGGTAVGLDPLALTAVTLHPAHRDPAHVGAVETLEHVVGLLRPHDADHQFHVRLPIRSGPRRGGAYSTRGGRAGVAAAGVTGTSPARGRLPRGG